MTARGRGKYKEHEEGKSKEVMMRKLPSEVNYRNGERETERKNRIKKGAIELTDNCHDLIYHQESNHLFSNTLW